MSVFHITNTGTKIRTRASSVFALAVGSLFGVAIVAAAHILFVDGLVAHDPCRALLGRRSAVPRLDTAVIGVMTTSQSSLWKYDSTSSRACQHQTTCLFRRSFASLFLSTARKFARCLCFLPIFTDKGRAATRPCCFAHSLFLAQFFTQPFRLLREIFRVFFVARLHVCFHQKLTSLCCFLFFSILLI